MNKENSWLTWTIVALFGVYTGYILMPQGDRDGNWNYHKFGTLPIQEGGRVKPIQTDAITDLTILNHNRVLNDPKAGRLPATKWYLDVITAEMRRPALDNNEDMDRKVIRIDNKEQRLMLTLLELEPRESQRYSVNEFLGPFQAMAKKLNTLRTKPDRSDDDNKILAELDGQVRYLVEHLKVAFTLFNLNHKILRIDSIEVLDTLGLKAKPGFRYSASDLIEGLEEFFTQAKRAKELDPKKRTLRDAKLLELYEHLGILIKLSRQEVLKVIPPNPGSDVWAAAWLTPEEASGDPARQNFASEFDKILKAYADGDKESFNKTVASFHKDMTKEYPAVMNRVGLEVYFNDVSPFYHGTIMYVFAALLGCFSWLMWFKPLNRAAFWATVLIFCLHSWALFIRMYLQGRPPVTNLYSSAIFIGWGCVGVCLIVEALFKNGIPLIVGNVTGALTLVIAHYLSASGDTMEMMQAVLDTNFWLATHVTCVTLGYTACFVAGFMGIAYIMLGLFTSALARDHGQALAKAIYGVVCFGMFLSFTGTVLGGIWADQSWGRFWGWDPKENGALLIVLWNALILHARWGGMIKSRGMANLAVLGNIITAWSWFGVNMLGVGLHSYGFMAGAFLWLMVFVISQLLIAGIGLVPLKYWQSFQPRKATAAVPGVRVSKMDGRTIGDKVAVSQD